MKPEYFYIDTDVHSASCGRTSMAFWDARPNVNQNSKTCTHLGGLSPLNINKHIFVAHPKFTMRSEDICNKMPIYAPHFWCTLKFTNKGTKYHKYFQSASELRTYLFLDGSACNLCYLRGWSFIWNINSYHANCDAVTVTYITSAGRLTWPSFFKNQCFHKWWLSNATQMNARHTICPLCAEICRLGFRYVILVGQEEKT